MYQFMKTSNLNRIVNTNKQYLMNVVLFICLQCKHMKVVLVITMYVVQSLLMLSIFFVQPNLGRDLVGTLTKIWPNLLRNRRDIYFWRDEYVSHGYCYFLTPKMYLESTVRMWGQIPPLTSMYDRRGCMLYFYIIQRHYLQLFVVFMIEES